MRFKKEIFLEASPEKYKIDEVYAYTQVFSTTEPTLKFDEDKSKGNFSIVFPFDGFKFFTREHLKKLLRRAGQRFVKKDKPGEIQIGQLLFSDYAKTDLGKILDLAERYDAIPLKIRFKGEGFPDEIDFDFRDNHSMIEHFKHLISDRYTCEVKYGYVPKALGPKTFDIHVQIFDPDNTVLDEKGHYQNIYQQYLDSDIPYNKVVNALRNEISFRSEIMLSIDILLKLPKAMAETKMAIAKLSMEWPYMPSFEHVTLCADYPNADVSAGSKAERKSVLGRCDPKGEKILWTGIPLLLTKSEPDALFRARWMDFMFKHPVDIFALDTIKGTMEIKIPEMVFSGLNVRVFDAWGKMIRDVEAKEKSSQVNINFEIKMRELFEKRKRIHCCMFYVDEILIENVDATSVEIEVKKRGYQIDPLSVYGRFNPLIIARKKMGAGTITLWINMEINSKNPHRIRDTGGEQIFSSQVSSGTINLYFRGEATNGISGLIQEINFLQQAIRMRLKKLSYKY